MTSERSYSLVEANPGAVLLELETGLILRLNQTAAMVWGLHLRGESSAAIADAVAKRFGVPSEVASRDVGAALEASGFATSPSVPSEFAESTEFRYERTSTGYTYLQSDRAVFEIDERGTTIALSRATDARRAEVTHLLINVAPKLLSLRGHVVLHASATVLGSSVVAFAGESGAGKTTTARAVVRAGAGACAEDKLVLRCEPGRAEAALNGETLIREWARQAAGELEGGQTASCQGLDLVANGPWLPLTELGFVEAARRRPGPVVATRVTALDATATIFQRAFLLSDAVQDWTRQLKASATIADAVAAYDLEMPDDLEALAAEARKIVSRSSFRPQTEMTTS